MEEYGIDLKVLARDRIQHEVYVVDHSFLALFHDRAAPARESRAGIGRITRRGDMVPAYSVTEEDLLVARQPDWP